MSEIPDPSEPAEAVMSDSAEAEMALQRLETSARYLYTNLTMMPVLGVTIAAIMLYWHKAADVGAWVAVTNVTWLVTMLVIHAFRNDPGRQSRLREWTFAIGASLAVATTAFASVALLLWVEGDRVNNALLYAILTCGMTICAAQSAPSRMIIVAAVPPWAILLVGVSLLHESFPLLIPILLLEIAYIALVILFSREMSNLSNEMLQLRMEKRSLISRLQAALAETETARNRAEAASLAKSEFLANMSHELRTPLNAILGFSEIIKGRMLGDGAIERYAEYGSHIHLGGRHLLGLISDILDLSKIEAGKLELDESDIHLTETAREAISMVEPQARQKQIELTLHSDGPFVVHADERAMRQVLANLLSNAVKFTPRGGKVTVRLSVTDSGDGLISVTDTGIGIKPEDMERVLENFGQGRHDIAPTDERGTGLGLPIVRGLAMLHGGNIRLESEVGRGTTAHVDIPALRIGGRKAGMTSAA